MAFLGERALILLLGLALVRNASSLVHLSIVGVRLQGNLSTNHRLKHGLLSQRLCSLVLRYLLMELILNLVSASQDVLALTVGAYLAL